jgi:hypothetical protein
MSDYRLDDRGSITGRGNGLFPLASAQTSFEAHPVSYPIGTGGPFPGVKSGRVVMLITQAHLLPRRRMSRSYTPLPLSAYRAISGATLLYFTYITEIVLSCKLLPFENFTLNDHEDEYFNRKISLEYFSVLYCYITTDHH